MCVSQLAEMIGGRLRLASMPPLAGGFTPIRRVVIDSAMAGPGDVYWALVGGGYDGAVLATDAFRRGAAGIVVANQSTEPWAGKFCIEVPDTNAALCRFARGLQRAAAPSRWPIALNVPDRPAALRAIADSDTTVLEDIIQSLRRSQAPAA